MTNGALAAVAQRDDRPDDLGDHVAGLAQHHGVADQHALALRPRRRCAGWPARRSSRRPGPASITAERRDPAGAADVDADVEQLGVDLLRRVLERDRPARRAARRAEPALQAEVVDLDHHAVDLVLDVVAVLAVVLDERLHAGQVGRPPAPGPRSAAPTPRARRTTRLRRDRRGRPRPCPTPCTTSCSPRDAVTRGSFCRSDPAAVLRGFANGALPAATSEAFSSSNLADREVDLAAHLQHASARRRR